MGGGPRGTRNSYAPKTKTINRTISEYKGKELLIKPKRRVFISFHMENEYAKQLLTMQAKNDKFDLEFVNYSVNEPFDERWREQCKERISKISTMIVLIGEETYQRPAVIWEINEAYRQGKNVVGVRIHRYKNHTVPKPLSENKAKIMNWDIETISNELSKD